VLGLITVLKFIEALVGTPPLCDMKIKLKQELYVYMTFISMCMDPRFIGPWYV